MRYRVDLRPGCFRSGHLTSWPDYLYIKSPRNSVLVFLYSSVSSSICLLEAIAVQSIRSLPTFVAFDSTKGPNPYTSRNRNLQPHSQSNMTVFYTLLTALLLPLTVLASTGTITGYPSLPAYTGAPYPITNSTIPAYTTGTGLPIPISASFTWFTAYTTAIASGTHHHHTPDPSASVYYAKRQVRDHARAF